MEGYGLSPTERLGAISGFLSLRHGSPRATIRRCYCVLHGVVLAEFDSFEDASLGVRPRSRLSVIGVSAWDGCNKGSYGLVFVMRSGLTVYATAKSADEQTQWVTAAQLTLRLALERSDSVFPSVDGGAAPAPDAESEQSIPTTSSTGASVAELASLVDGVSSKSRAFEDVALTVDRLVTHLQDTNSLFAVSLQGVSNSTSSVVGVVGVVAHPPPPSGPSSGPSAAGLPPPSQQADARPETRAAAAVTTAARVVRSSALEGVCAESPTPREIEETIRAARGDVVGLVRLLYDHTLRGGLVEFQLILDELSRTRVDSMEFIWSQVRSRDPPPCPLGAAQFDRALCGGVAPFALSACRLSTSFICSASSGTACAFSSPRCSSECSLRRAASPFT